MTKKFNSIQEVFQKKEDVVNKAIEDRLPKSTRWKGVHCSFCGINETEVELLIAGPNKVHICNECVVLIFNGLEDFKKNKK